MVCSRKSGPETDALWVLYDILRTYGWSYCKFEIESTPNLLVFLFWEADSNKDHAIPVSPEPLYRTSYDAWEKYETKI